MMLLITENRSNKYPVNWYHGFVKYPFTLINATASPLEALEGPSSLEPQAQVGYAVISPKKLTKCNGLLLNKGVQPVNFQNCKRVNFTCLTLRQNFRQKFDNLRQVRTKMLKELHMKPINFGQYPELNIIGLGYMLFINI